MERRRHGKRFIQAAKAMFLGTHTKSGGNYCDQFNHK
jgi:hypothetical protein